MQPTTVHAHHLTSSRTATCLWCHEVTTQSDAIRNHGLCGRCVRENRELAWRVVYDRDRKIGKIPRNLRAAYRL
jgi:hypothetical protein